MALTDRKTVNYNFCEILRTLLVASFILQMWKVRRSLTEILLEVTNEEIGAICREVWSRARAKGTPDTHHRTNQLNFRAFAYRSTEFDSMSLLAALCCDEVVRLYNTKLKVLNKRDSLMRRLDYSAISGHPAFLCFQGFCM